jgi:hypothetical protein
MAVLPRRDPQEVMSPVSDHRIPQEAARAAVLKEALSLRIEEELSRLYTARPELSVRIDRASSLVVRQLSVPPRQRSIKVRLSKTGPHFLVASASVAGAVYTVDPHRGFRCSCPDAITRRSQACKHSLAAWLLWKVSPRKTTPSAPPAVGVLGSGTWYCSTPTTTTASRTAMGTGSARAAPRRRGFRGEASLRAGAGGRNA